MTYPSAHPSLIVNINVAAAGMAQALGMSQESVIRECTIRELLLFLSQQRPASDDAE